MTTLTIHRKMLTKVGIPYWVFINEQLIGLMRGRNVCVQMPEGTFRIGVKILFQIWKWRFEIGGVTNVNLTEGQEEHLLVTDKERWWNFIFNIDLILWIMSFFVTIPYPWNIVYHIASEGFFALWLLRIVIIRKRYFILKHIEQ